MKVKLIVDGGKMQPGPAVSQQLGPMGINLGKVISEVNDATKSFSGIKVPIELNIDAKTKNFTIEIFSPPVAELIKKELGIEKGSGQPNSIKVGNVPIETLISIAKTKMPNLLAKDIKGALKLIVGTCVSLGVLIENKEAKEIEIEINSGNYDTEIENLATTPSEEKISKLKKFFDVRKAKQEKDIKAAEAAAKVAEEEAKKKEEKQQGEKKAEVEKSKDSKIEPKSEDKKK